MRISHRYGPKTFGADGIYRAIRVRTMDEFTHCPHRFAPIGPEFKVLRGLKLLLTPMSEAIDLPKF
jgi:hypothetical protein